MVHRRLTALLVLISFFLAFVVPRPVSAGGEPPLVLGETGFVNIVALHDGVAVRINDERVGVTPLAVHEVQAGRHLIQVSHPDQHKWLEKDFKAEIDVTVGDTVVVQVRFVQSYTINSMPYGATVTAAGEVIGRTPFYIQVEEMTTRPVVVSKHGFMDSTIVVGADDVKYFDIRLKSRLLSSADVPPNAFSMKKKSRSNTPLLATLGLSLAAGGLALYFRTRADNRYDRYLATGKPQKLSRFYNDAKRLDRFAAASFAVFQVSFGISFVLFLKRAKQN